MNLEVILLGCYLMLAILVSLQVTMNKRSQDSLRLYQESLAIAAALERERLEELRHIRRIETLRLIETRKITKNMR